MPHEADFQKLLDLLWKMHSAHKLEDCIALVDGAIHRAELLKAAVTKAASKRGRLGGTKTAERGPEYFAKIAAMRKTRGGGRPKKIATSNSE